MARRILTAKHWLIYLFPRNTSSKIEASDWSGLLTAHVNTMIAANYFNNRLDVRFGLARRLHSGQCPLTELCLCCDELSMN